LKQRKLPVCLLSHAKDRADGGQVSDYSLLVLSGISNWKISLNNTHVHRELHCAITHLKLTVRNPRHNATSEEEKTRRRIMAESSAVDFPNLGGPSTLAERWSRTSRPLRPLSTPATLEASNLILLEVGPDHKLTRPITQIRPGQSRPIPLLEVHPTSKTKGMRRSRKGKRKRAEAAYYCPSGELGGKSQMTLWGYGVGMPVKVRSRR
jgi:hypothetical protein